MPNTIETALKGFEQISAILDFPAQGRHLLDNRRWRLPCPDKKAFADYPEPKEKRDKWLYEWAHCEELATGIQQANQSSNAT